MSNYNEEKLISNVKGMDSDLKNKIKKIKEEAEEAESQTSVRKPPISLTVLKQNDELIK